MATELGAWDRGQGPCGKRTHLPVWVCLIVSDLAWAHVPFADQTKPDKSRQNAQGKRARLPHEVRTCHPEPLRAMLR